ncbi:MAG: tetratricopeptide repeat protein [Parcubacteria group bacterium]|nr:tetratricopeptide repeat protein [Parcubacteria group bacterium]
MPTEEQENGKQLREEGLRLLQEEKWQEAIDPLARALQVDENDTAAIHALGIAYMKVGLLADALDVVLRVTRIAPGVTEVCGTLGHIYTALSRWQEAMIAFGRYLPDHKGDIGAMMGLAKSLEHLDRSQDAATLYQIVVHLEPNNVLARQELGKISLGLGRHQEAIPHLEKGILPGGQVTRVNLATCYIRTGRATDAIPLLQQVVRLNPDDYEAHYILGFVYHQLGQLDMAEKETQEALRVQPESDSAHNRLEAILAQKKASQN